MISPLVAPSNGWRVCQKLGKEVRKGAHHVQDPAYHHAITRGDENRVCSGRAGSKSAIGWCVKELNYHRKELERACRLRGLSRFAAGPLAPSNLVCGRPQGAVSGPLMRPPSLIPYELHYEQLITMQQKVSSSSLTDFQSINISSKHFHEGPEAQWREWLSHLGRMA
jgi:hypothetical protein